MTHRTTSEGKEWGGGEGSRVGTTNDSVWVSSDAPPGF